MTHMRRHYFGNSLATRRTSLKMRCVISAIFVQPYTVWSALSRNTVYHAMFRKTAHHFPHTNHFPFLFIYMKILFSLDSNNHVWKYSINNTKHRKNVTKLIANGYKWFSWIAHLQKSSTVPKSLELFGRSEIWQVVRQQRCRGLSNFVVVILFQ